MSEKKKDEKGSHIDGYKMEFKTTGDYKDDPDGAMNDLAKAGFAIHVISKGWYTDEKAQKQWRFTKDIKKPTIYIIRENGIDGFRPDMFYESVIATIMDHGNQEETARYVQTFIATFIKNLKSK